MIKFIKKTVVAIQIATIALLFLHMGTIYFDGINTENILTNEVVILNAQLNSQKTEYEDTIVKIVENVKMTDSYLFTGGFTVEEANAFNIKSYEDMLTLNNDFTDMLNDLDNFFGERTEYFNDLPNIWPLFSTNRIAISSGFGDRFSPITGKITKHEGIDLVTNWADPVIATADGYVEDNWIQHWIMGKWVVIKHKNGIETEYAHMSRVIVHEGDLVKKGQVIGYLGNSGVSTGPHLHYAVKKDGVFIDPINFLRQAAVSNKQ